jgi:hypothetical protein
MEDEDVAEFGDLWSPSAKQNYCLIHYPEDDAVLEKCMIYSKDTKTLTIIESGSLALKVMRKMFDAGVPIVRWPSPA